MKRTSYNPKTKKPKYFLGGGPMFEAGKFTDQGTNMASLGANALGTIGDIASAEGPSIGGGIMSGAGKGAQMGLALGPWGAAAGAVVGGVAGAFNSKKLLDDERRAEEAELDASEQRAVADSQTVLSNYNNKGINKGSTFATGGMMHYPYQEQDEGNMIAPTIQLAKGGNLNPISDTTVEVNGHNPNITDGVEIENAFVDDGETIESLAQGGEVERVYTDKFGVDGKKSSKKNPSFANMHKKLQKSKSEDPRHKEFNTFIDRKSDNLFQAQEALKEEDNAFGRYENGGDISNKGQFQEGGKIEKGETRPLTQDLQDQLLGNVFEEGVSSAADIKAEKEFSLFEEAVENNPQFKGGPEATVANPQMTYKVNSDAINSWYKDEVFPSKVQGKDMFDVLSNSATKLNLDPTELTAAMSQEGFNSKRFNEELELSGSLGSYNYGLDTPGNYKDVIEKKLGKDALKDVEYVPEENERGQAVEYGKFKDIQQMSDASAAVYQHRSKAVSQTAKDLGIDMAPWEKQYFNYLGYNTQHNADNPVIRGNLDKKENYNSSIKNVMLDYKNKYKILGKSKEEFDEFVKTTRKGGTNPYGDPDSGRGQLFKNAGDSYSRIADLEGVYSEDLPFNIKAPEKTPEKELPSYLPTRENGGYTDMNTLSAEHMKAGISLKKKKKNYAFGGYQGGGTMITPGPINERSMSTMKDVLSKRKKKSYQDGGSSLDKYQELNTFKPTRRSAYQSLNKKIKDKEAFDYFSTQKAPDTVKAGVPEYNYSPPTPDSSITEGRISEVAAPETSEKRGFDVEKFGDALGSYGADIAGMFTRLPKTPISSKLGRTRLEETDNKEELDRISRGYRGAARGLEESAQAGAVESTKSSLFAKKLQAENASFDKLNKLNEQTRNRQAAINAQERATDTRIENIDKQTELSKQLKEREIRRDSLVNISNKFMAGKAEDKSKDLDLNKLKLLLAGTKGTGVGERLTSEEKALAGLKYGGLMKKKRKRKVA